MTEPLESYGHEDPEGAFGAVLLILMVGGASGFVMGALLVSLIWLAS